jgi:hypothetical protein
MTLMKWTACLLFVLLAGCYESNGITLSDAGDAGSEDPVDARDPRWDTLVDPADAPADTTPDTRPDVGVDPDAPCTYPTGPYRYTTIGDTVAPASWPASIKAEGESLLLDHADFEVLYCDPEVESIVIFLATVSDPMCPGRIREMVSLESNFDTCGTKFIWILAWDGGTLPTPAMAESYYTSNGVDFGWFTDDEDNTWDPYIFHNNPFGSGVPWLGIIDADTMQVYATAPDDLLEVIRELAMD